MPSSAGRLKTFQILVVSIQWGTTVPSLAQDPPVNALLVGQWDQYDGLYSDLWSDGHYVYMGNFGWDDQRARIQIIDIRNPTNPVLDNIFYLPQPNRWASPQDVQVADGLLYVALESNGFDGVSIIDVRDPTAPAQLTTLSSPADVHTLSYDSGFLYLADSSYPSVTIVDMSTLNPDDPGSEPTYKWTLSGIGTSFVHEATAKDGRLYCAAWESGLWVYDISDVANTLPVLLGSVDGDNTHTAWPTDDGRFVVTAEERENGPIKVYRIDDNKGSLSFTQTDSYELPQAAYCVHQPWFVGYRLYVAWYQAGIQVFDLDPDTGLLAFRSSFDTSEHQNNYDFDGAWGVYPLLGDDRLLVSDIHNGLSVVASLPDDCTPGDDCNLNAEWDYCDLMTGVSDDCNRTFVPDECELADGSSTDCQANGIPDECEIDCNANAVPDDCDIASGTSLDCQENAIPDDCETDCNANGVPDDCDLSNGNSLDCNLNMIPDECDGDCNDNDVPDDCDLASGTSPDCRANGVPDECDIASGNSQDADGNGVPDECDTDCDLFTRLQPDDLGESDQFGAVIAAQEDQALIGASSADGLVTNAGAVYRLERVEGEWVFTQKLVAEDGSASDSFGASVAMSGEWAVIGASGDDDGGTDSGSVYLFHLDDGFWVQRQKLMAEDAAVSDRFGSHVAIFEDVVAVGVHSNDDQGTSAGAVYVYRYSGTEWEFDDKLYADQADEFDYFGIAVALNDETLFVGTNQPETAGAVHVFSSGDGSWDLQDVLTATPGSTDDDFGGALAVEDDLLLVGADGANDYSGAAYVFRFDGAQ